MDTYNKKKNMVQVKNKNKDLELKEVFDCKIMNYKDLNKNYALNKTTIGFKNNNYVLTNMPNIIYEKASIVEDYNDMENFIGFLSRYLKDYDHENTIDYSIDSVNCICKALRYLPKEPGHRTIFYFLKLDTVNKYLQVSCQKLLLPYQITSSFSTIYNRFINYYNINNYTSLFRGNFCTWFTKPFYNVYDNDYNGKDWNSDNVHAHYCLGNSWDFFSIAETMIKNINPTNCFTNAQLFDIVLYYVERLQSFDSFDIEEDIMNSLRGNVSSFTMMFIDKPSILPEIQDNIFALTYSPISIFLDEHFIFNLNQKYQELHYLEF